MSKEDEGEWPNNEDQRDDGESVLNGEVGLKLKIDPLKRLGKACSGFPKCYRYQGESRKVKKKTEE